MITPKAHQRRRQGLGPRPQEAADHVPPDVLPHDHAERPRGVQALGRRDHGVGRAARVRDAVVLHRGQHLRRAQAKAHLESWMLCRY
eukprot:scaffold4613_cov129-Isochrysis_galbana.AAC.1